MFTAVKGQNKANKKLKQEMTSESFYSTRERSALNTHHHHTQEFTFYRNVDCITNTAQTLSIHFLFSNGTLIIKFVMMTTTDLYYSV